MNQLIQLKPIWLLLPLIIAVLFGILFFALLVRHRNMIHRQQEEIVRQREELELQVEKAKAAAKAKSDFLSRMSHEIRTPLNAMIGMAQIAQNTSYLPKIKNCMSNLETSTKHLLGIVNDILDFSKIEAGQLVFEEQPFSLRQSIEFVLAMLRPKAEEKHIQLRCEACDISHDGVVTDTLRLNQVLINLLSNAIKFTDKDGFVFLKVQELVHMQGESVYQFSVRDNGVGIAPEQARKLFTPFTQANASVARLYGGTGLGLSISQAIVQMMGGEIELETKPGAGSVFQFTIRVPATQGVEARPAEDDFPDFSRILKGKRILIVDDIDINREIVTELLCDSGAILEAVSNGKEALDIFCDSDPYWYDMILMDMLMPVMDGCTATLEIRNCGKADAKQVKIVAMTANVLQEDMTRAYESGMNGYVTKPIDLGTLYKTMEEWL